MVRVRLRRRPQLRQSFSPRPLHHQRLFREPWLNTDNAVARAIPVQLDACLPTSAQSSIVSPERMSGRTRSDLWLSRVLQPMSLGKRSTQRTQPTTPRNYVSISMFHFDSFCASANNISSPLSQCFFRFNAHSTPTWEVHGGHDLNDPE